MTKKDYERLAEAFQWALRQAETAATTDGVHIAMRNVAEALRADNPRFDRTRFLAACVPGANVKARTR